MRTVTQEQRDQISKALKGIRRSPETRAAMSASKLYNRETQTAEWEDYRARRLREITAIDKALASLE